MSNLLAGETGAPVDPREALLQILNNYMLSQCIYVAAKLGVADLLAGGPRPVEELAKATDVNPNALYRVLRALASGGIFVEAEDRRFRLNAMADVLRSDVKDSVRSWAVFRGDGIVWKPWGSILHAVRTGESAFAHAMGEPVFEHLPKDPDAAQVFDNAMRSISERKFRSVAKAYDFTGLKKLIDVGGGNGGMLTAILQATPGLKGVLAEMPHVLDDARKHLAAVGLDGRCECAGIDMFESVPEGGDAYLMGNIIHDWDDERSIRILKNCRRAMGAGDRVLLVELVLPEAGRNEFSLSTIIDIEMLVMTEGGRERTAEEYGALFEAAGLRLTKVVPTESWWSVVEGVAV